jgi:hypothetical protein
MFAGYGFRLICSLLIHDFLLENLNLFNCLLEPCQEDFYLAQPDQTQYVRLYWTVYIEKAWPIQ